MQQEIFLPINSSFARLQMNKVKKEESKKSSRKEAYEEDCINSLLQELLPMFLNNKSNSKMHLWQLHSGFSSLHFEFGEVPANIDMHYSIDPHNFLVTTCNN